MKIRSISSAACCLALFAGAGMAQTASLSNTDRNFMSAAARIDMIEAHEGQMAENQALRSDVKNCAKTVVQDHTQSYERLAVLANKTGASIPKGINSAKDPGIRELVHLKGDRFDRQFTREEIAADKQAIALYKREADHGQNPDVKAYATQTLPILKKDLRLAEDCAKPVGRT